MKGKGKVPVLDGSQFNDHGWSYIYTVKNMVT